MKVVWDKVYAYFISVWVAICVLTFMDPSSLWHCSINDYTYKMNTSTLVLKGKCNHEIW